MAQCALSSRVGFVSEQSCALNFTFGVKMVHNGTYYAGMSHKCSSDMGVLYPRNLQQRSSRAKSSFF